ncbi:hypothetical protein BDR26DRAFT_676847 [Obelidium mucronatum]|nr:hypothetical protein BDR26DRAFT_676847 [Obelidium mucronatum]
MPEPPKSFPVGMQPEPETVTFDEQIHLAITPPPQVFSMTMDPLQFPYQSNKPSFGITQAFPVFSAAGTQAVKGIIAAHKQDPRICRSSNRAQLYLRGLGFLSPFICALNNSPQIINLVSQLAGEPLAPHTMIQNYAHTNIGTPAQNNNNQEVDALHADSVDYVLVVMLSDPSKFKGGELEAVRIQPLSAAMEAVGNGALTPEDVISVPFTQQGQGMFMRGSQFLHRVRPVLETIDNEARITCVFSFMSRNPKSVECTRLGTYIGDRDPYCFAEFARHKVWRTVALLKQIEEMGFDAAREDLVDVLEQGQRELKDAIAILKLEKDDTMPYFDAKVGKFVTKR